MRRLGKMLTLVLSLLLAVAMIAPPALAAETETIAEYNQKVAQAKTNLEKKYGIKITYPVGNANSRAGIGTGSLSTLDTCLNYITTDVVKQLSTYYKERNGAPLTFVYKNPTTNMQVQGGTILASFVEETSTMTIYIPKNGSTVGLSGSSPTAIVHEMGHAFHTFINEKYGASKLKKEWTALNGGKAYGGGFDKATFVSEYASTDYDEDFADTFAHAFVCDRAGYSIAANLKTSSGGSTNLGKKVAMIETLLPKYLTSTETALANIRKCYSTPSTTTYQGLRLSGNSLEYIGFNAPHNVLKGLLKSMNITAASSSWDKTIGGWVVTDDKGKNFLLFPGGATADLK